MIKKSIPRRVPLFTGNRTAYDVATALMNQAEQLPPRPAIISNPHILAALQDFGTKPVDIPHPVNISAAEPQGDSKPFFLDFGDLAAIVDPQKLFRGQSRTSLFDCSEGKWRLSKRMAN